MTIPGVEIDQADDRDESCGSTVDDVMGWVIIGGATLAPGDKELRVQLNQQMEIENCRIMFQYQ